MNRTHDMKRKENGEKVGAKKMDDETRNTEETKNTKSNNRKEDSKKDSVEHIRCVLRIRPRLNKSEKDLPQHINVSSTDPRKIIVSPHGRRYPVSREFELDHVLGPSSSNADVYNSIKDSIQSFTKGLMRRYSRSGSPDRARHIRY